MASQAHPTNTATPSAAATAAQGGGGANTQQTAAELPGGIEIFRAGTHRDDAGNSHTFTRAQLEEMVATYNAAVREAPLTVGHPKDNLPAYGWVKRVFINDAGNLAVDPHQVDPAFAEMVKAQRFKKRSASFYPPGAPHNPTPGKWYLRHVAFLGAQPPAVAGLKDIDFMDHATEAVSFSETADAPAPAPMPAAGPPQGGQAPMGGSAPREAGERGGHFSSTTQPQEQTMSDADKAELERLRADSKAKDDANAKLQADLAAANTAKAAAEKTAASFAEKAAADRRAGFVAFAEGEVKAGRLLPKDKATAVATLETLAAVSEPVSFSEGASTTQITPLQMCAWLQGHMSSRTAVVSFGEMATAQLGQGFDARGKTDEEIDQAARRYQGEHPEVSYAEALGKVTSFTS